MSLTEEIGQVNGDSIPINEAQRIGFHIFGHTTVNDNKNVTNIDDITQLTNNIKQ